MRDMLLGLATLALVFGTAAFVVAYRRREVEQLRGVVIGATIAQICMAVIIILRLLTGD